MRLNLLVVILSAACAVHAETYLVAAAVEQYDDQSISPLKYTIRDVTAFAALFRGAGVPDGQVVVLSSDQTDRRRTPTKFNLLHALQQVRERARGDDTLVFYFAGHGMEKDGEPYLLTSDSIREQLEGTALPMSLVHGIMNGFETKRVLFIIDACRNDPEAGRAEGDAQLSEEFARNVRPRLTAEPAAAAVEPALLLACDIGQRAWEMPDEQHGAFTYWMLKGLRGEAAGDDGRVALHELADYLTAEVAAWARRAGREQTPRFVNPSGNDFVLLEPPAAPAPPSAPVAPPTVPPEPPADWPDYLPVLTLPEGFDRDRFRLAPVDGMPQVFIPAGEFMMGTPPGPGSNDERPQRSVYVSAYWIDLHEVTVAQYRRFCAAAGHPLPGLPPGVGDHHPVTSVTWDDATAYAAWAGRRLPTEAQWEKAARGGRFGADYPWGDEWDPALANANQRATTPVATYPPNAFGLYDLAGNAYEWCRDAMSYDWYRRMPDRDPVNEQHRNAMVLRGGAFRSSRNECRVGYRYSLSPGMKVSSVGFRCVSDAGGQVP